MAKCFSCNKKLGLTEGYNSGGVSFCNKCFSKKGKGKQLKKQEKIVKKHKETPKGMTFVSIIFFIASMISLLLASIALISTFSSVAEKVFDIVAFILFFFLFLALSLIYFFIGKGLLRLDELAIKGGIGFCMLGGISSIIYFFEESLLIGGLSAIIFTSIIIYLYMMRNHRMIES